MSIFPSHVVFLCMANINRSPMAAAVFEAQVKLLGLECKVESAGILPDMSGRPAAAKWTEIPEARQYDLSQHRSKHYSSLAYSKNTLVVCLEPKVVGFILGHKGVEQQKVRILCAPRGVPDPIFGSGEYGFGMCLARIEDGIKELFLEFPKP